MAENGDIGKQLNRIEAQYLNTQLSADDSRKPELVSFVTEKLILEKLSGLYSDVAYTGSNYEYTTVPGKSDFDIQLFLKLPNTRSYGQVNYSATAEVCGNGEWMKVRGGPSDLQNRDGYLSTEKARRQMQSKIDQVIHSHTLSFGGSDVRIRRSMSGPATTLDVEWKTARLSIDIVVGLQAKDVGDRYGGSCAHDLVGKSHGGGTLVDDGMWRVSYSREELNKLRQFHRTAERKIILLRIMKVIKGCNPQLRYFPSFFYKNLLLTLDEDNPRASWDRQSFPERFKDMVKLMQRVLEARRLPLHFNKNVNYLAGMDPSAVTNAANYLRRVINNNGYAEMLRSV